MIVRTGLVLDPASGLLKQLLLPFRLGLGGPVAGGDQYMSWIHIDDETGILLWALDNESVSGVINATAPNPVTNRELSKTLGRVLRARRSIPVPGFALNLLYGSEFAETVRGRPAGDAAPHPRPRLRLRAPRAGAGPARPARLTLSRRALDLRRGAQPAAADRVGGDHLQGRVAR